MHIEIKDKTTQEVFSDFYRYLKIEFYSSIKKARKQAVGIVVFYIR